MPVNPDQYRKFLTDEKLTSEQEDLIIHSLSNILEGLMDRRTHSLDRMRHQKSGKQVNSKTDQTAIALSNMLPAKEET